MTKIPFALDTSHQNICGYLTAPHGSGNAANDVPRHFHVYVQKDRGSFYYGQLMWNQMKQDWWLPDSALQPYTAYLGNLVELWFE